MTFSVRSQAKDEVKSNGLDEKIENLGNGNDKTFFHKLLRGSRLFLIVDFGGALLPNYQRRHAKQLGWEPKDMTIRNALYCGILPALGYATLRPFLGDRFEFVQTLLEGYTSTFLFAQNIGRIALAQTLKEPIPAISLVPAITNLGYFIRDLYSSGKS